MWELKKFETLEQQRKWVEQNKEKYQIDVLYVNNGYMVEYRKKKAL